MKIKQLNIKGCYLINFKVYKDHRGYFKRDFCKKVVSEEMKVTIREKNEHMIFSKVYKKYVLLRIRAKISYMALLKRMTIVELFAVAI